NRKVLWKFTEMLNLRTIQHAYISIPIPPGGAAYRFSIRAKSAHQSTYIVVSSIKYSLERTCSKCKLDLITTSPATATTQSSAVSTVGPKALLDCDFERGNTCNWKSPNGNGGFMVLRCRNVLPMN